MPTNDASRLNGPDLQPIEPPSRQQSSDLQPVRYFLAVFLISAFFLGRILWPFWSILVLSFLLTSMFRPVYAFLHRWLPVYAASILTCVLIVALVFVPLLFFTGSLAGEALNLYNWGRDAQVGLKLQTFLQESPPARPPAAAVARVRARIQTHHGHRHPHLPGQGRGALPL